MRGLGLSTKTSDGRPQVVGVVVERINGELQCEEAFHFNADAQQDFALQLAALGSALESKLPSVKAHAVVVRTLDYSRQRRRDRDVAIHYATEGVLLAVSRRQVELTLRLRGKEIGEKCGRDKQTVDADAAKLCGDRQKEAGAAAMAAVIAAENR